MLIQLVLATTFFGAIDLFAYGPLPGDAALGGPLPWPAVVGIFVAMSVRSRLFSPLDNSRPELRNVITEADDEKLAELIAQPRTRATTLRAEAERRGLAADGTMVRKELEVVLEKYFASKAAGGGAL